MNKQILLAALIYWAAISLLTAMITAFDKHKAKNGKRRIPEKTLFIFAALGGGAAEYAVMKLIRHKTLHKKFMIGLPVIIILHILIIALCCYYFL